MADAIQQGAAAAAASLSVATSGPDACVDVRTLMDVVKTSAVELAFATRYQVAEDALEAAISSGRSVALVHPGRDAFDEKNAPRSWSFDPTIAKAKVKRGKGSGHLRSQLERDLGGFIAVFLGSAIKGSNAPDTPAATLLKPLRDEFVEAVMKEVASMQRRLDRREAQASVPAALSAAAQAVDTRLFGPELERLLTGDAADPEILHKAVEILMTFPAVKQMMIAGGSPRVQKAGAAGSMQKEAGKKGRIGRRDVKARLAVLPVMHLAAIASSVNCPNWLLWRGLVEAALGRTSRELDDLAKMRICANRKAIHAYEEEYAGISIVSAAFWARKIIDKDGYVANLVDNASSTILGKFQGGDKSTAAQIHYSVQCLLGGNLENKFKNVTTATPQWVCVTKGSGFYGHAFPEKLSTGTASTSAVGLKLPRVINVDESVAGTGTFAGNNVITIHGRGEDGSNLDLQFLELTTMAKVMEALPDLGVPSSDVPLWANLTREQLDPSKIVWTDDDADLSNRASTRDAAHTMLYYALADGLTRVQNLGLLPKGLKFDEMPTLDTLFGATIAVVNPFHEKKTPTRVLPASPHNELTTEGALNILRELLPRQSPYKFGMPPDKFRKKLDSQLADLEARVRTFLRERAERIEHKASARSRNLELARRALEPVNPVAAPAATPATNPRRSPRNAPAPAAAPAPAPTQLPAESSLSDAEMQQIRDLVKDGVIDVDEGANWIAETEEALQEAPDDEPRRRPLEVLLEQLRHEVDDFSPPRFTKGQSMACADGLTVSRFAACVEKAVAQMLERLPSHQEALQMCNIFSLLLSLSVVEHDRLHGVFHLLHLCLKHDFDFHGRPLLQLRNLNKVGPTSAEAGQEVRKKLHHEHVRLVGTVVAVVEEMLKDSEYSYYIDQLPRNKDDAVSARDFLKIYVDYLSSGAGGADFTAARDHLLLASLLRGFKHSLQWRHWPMTLVAEMATGEAMIQHGKHNYGNFHFEAPYKLVFRSLAQTLFFCCRVMTTTERGGRKTGIPSGDVHEALVKMSSDRLKTRNWNASVRVGEGRGASNRGVHGSADRDREKMERDTAASGLSAAVLGGFQAATELTRPPRDYWGGVGTKGDVQRIAAYLLRAGTCGLHPSRTAFSSYLHMLHAGRVIHLVGDQVPVFLTTAQFVISDAPATRGLPKFNDLVSGLDFLSLEEDEVLVALAFGAERELATSRNVDVFAINHLFEPEAPRDVDSDDEIISSMSRKLGTLCPDLRLDPHPDIIRLHVFSPKAARNHVVRDTIHVNVQGTATRLSDEDRVLQTMLGKASNAPTDQLEEEDDADGPPRDTLAGTPFAGRARVPTALPKKLSAAAKLLHATEPLDHEHVSRRAERRKGADGRLEEAKDLLFRGPHAVVAGDPDPDNIPLDRINDEEEEILTRIDQYVAQRRAVNEKYQSVLNEKSVFVSHQDYRTLVGGRQQLQAIDARANALAKEKDHLGRKIKYLQRERAELRRAQLGEVAAASSSDEEDESGDKSDAESGDDDDAHVRRDEVLVFSDDDADHESPGGDDD